MKDNVEDMKEVRKWKNWKKNSREGYSFNWDKEINEMKGEVEIR